jgi:di/tricarboxylate transporter
MDVAIVLVLLLIALVLFSLEQLSIELISSLLVLTLLLSGILTPQEAFAGFGSDFIIILASIFIISAAIKRTGVLDYLGTYLVKKNPNNSNLILSVLLLLTGALSAFMNNTSVTALLVNPVISVSKTAKISPSRFLMPMAFASIIGGTCTLIGTSTNIAVSGYISKIKMEDLGIFEIFPLGLILFAVSIIYLLTIGRKLLPERKSQDLPEAYGMREYLCEVVIMANSKLIGQSVFDSDLNSMGFRTLGLIRDNRKYFPGTDTIVDEGDTLLIEGSVEDLMKVKDTEGIEIKGDLLDFYSDKTKEVKLLEILIPLGSNLLSLQVNEINFRQRYGLVILAAHRAGHTLRKKIGEVKLQVGDLFLVQGNPENLAYLYKNPNLIVLGDYSPVIQSKRKGFLTLLYFMLAIVLASLGILPLATAVFSAAILTILSKAISVEKAYDNMEWGLLILIAGMSAFGTAMEKSGADLFLANNILLVLNPLGIYAVMAGLILLTVILTQPMSNAAAALVMLPIAIQVAHQIGVNPRTFAIMIMISASISLIAPFEPSCILVYGPGKYKFLDFIKVGGGLTLIMVVLLLILVPFFWPLYP